MVTKRRDPSSHDGTLCVTNTEKYNLDTWAWGSSVLEHSPSTCVALGYSSCTTKQKMIEAHEFYSYL